MRDLKYLIELYDNKCDWAVQMKDLVIRALNLKKTLVIPDYYGPNKKRNTLEKAMVTLL